jgi:hypothetical protein
MSNIKTVYRKFAFPVMFLPLFGVLRSAWKFYDDKQAHQLHDAWLYVSEALIFIVPINLFCLFMAYRASRNK